MPGSEDHRAGLPTACSGWNPACRDTTKETTTKFIIDMGYLVICRMQKMAFREWGAAL